MARILVVDDEPNMRRVLSSILEGEGHDVSEAGSVATARRQLATAAVDVVLTDQRLGDGEGLELLAELQELDPAVPVVMITAFATVDLAVSALRQGAFDFVAKPFEPDAVRAVVRRAAERAELIRENARLRRQVRSLAATEQLVGNGPVMARLRDLVGRVAPTDATVLITGETGTGKELVARAVHAASPRAEGPFVAVNCAGFAETLLESELFGHERGAFTGADRARQGVFEAAHRGTLFLDEAGEMPLALQAKLLRVLMGGEVLRVGSTVPRAVDVRIVVATNRDLEAEVRGGGFREDLYYRLAVFPLQVPPLRERREDVPALVQHLLERVARDLNVPPRPVAPEAMAKLLAYDFPGNVRELRNLLERASILARGERIEASDLPVPSGAEEAAAFSGVAEGLAAAFPPRVDLRKTLDEVERALITRALEAAGGVQAEAARRLGVSRSALAYRLRRLDLEPDSPAER